MIGVVDAKTACNGLTSLHSILQMNNMWHASTPEKACHGPLALINTAVHCSVVIITHLACSPWCCLTMAAKNNHGILHHHIELVACIENQRLHAGKRSGREGVGGSPHHQAAVQAQE